MNIKAALGSVECKQTCLTLCKIQSDEGCRRNRGECIQDIVQSGDKQRRRTEAFAQMPDLEGRGLLRGMLDIGRAPFTVRAGAEAEHGLSGDGCHCIAAILVVSIVEYISAGFLRKLCKGCLEVLQRVEIFHMILVDIQDHRDIRRKMQECVHIFARLADEHITAACSAAAADRRELAADHRGKINSCGEQDLREHRGCCRLAVRTGNADRIGIPFRDKPEQLTALHHCNAGSLCCRALGIRLCDRRRIDDQIRIRDILRALPELHRNPQRPHRCQRIRLVVIRAGQIISFCMQHLCQRIHAAAADADHMDMLLAF